MTATPAKLCWRDFLTRSGDYNDAYFDHFNVAGERGRARPVSRAVHPAQSELLPAGGCSSPRGSVTRLESVGPLSRRQSTAESSADGAKARRVSGGFHHRRLETRGLLSQQAVCQSGN